MKKNVKKIKKNEKKCKKKSVISIFRNHFPQRKFGAFIFFPKVSRLVG